MNVFCLFSIAIKLEYNVTRAYMGSFMTSLEMAGVSLTLLKLTDRWAECLGNFISILKFV